ncbi:MAG: DUF1080 domain-containing protein [Planctomycetia bacterium]|nr:DUF1080 domain-containing protein [Planctomycetia bacterium]
MLLNSGRMIAALCVLFAATVARSAEPGLPTFTSADEAGADFAIQGEYVGEVNTGDGPMPFGVQVLALGDGKFRAVAYPGGLPGAGWKRGDDKHVAEGKMENGQAVFSGDDGGQGVVKDGALHVSHGGGKASVLKKVERKSETLGEEAPDGAIVLFDGSSTDHFVDGKLVEENLLASGCASKEEMKDHTMHIEFRTPFMPTATGQARGNSGVYVQDRYEIQVLDSFALEGENNECGGLYSMKAPAVNMCYPPLAWQTYDIDFTAAKFDAAGKKTSNARLTLLHNGVKIYDDMELADKTPGGAPQEAPGVGPLKLQDHGNPVAFRNIWIVEKK